MTGCGRYVSTRRSYGLYIFHRAQRISANMDSVNRCKLSVIAQATAELSEPLVPDALAPYDDHLWPSNLVSGEMRMKVTPMTAVTMVPLEQQVRSRVCVETAGR